MCGMRTEQLSELLPTRCCLRIKIYEKRGFVMSKALLILIILLSIYIKNDVVMVLGSVLVQMPRGGSNTLFGFGKTIDDRKTFIGALSK